MRRPTALALVALWCALAAPGLRAQAPDDDAPPPLLKIRSAFQIPAADSDEAPPAEPAPAPTAAGPAPEGRPPPPPDQAAPAGSGFAGPAPVLRIIAPVASGQSDFATSAAGPPRLLEVPALVVPVAPALAAPTEPAPAKPLAAGVPGVTLVSGGANEASDLSVPEPDSEWVQGFGLHPFVETGVNIVRPAFERSAAVIVSRPPNGTGAPAGFSSSTFGYDLGVAPRVAVGITNDDGWGLQVSWWSFDQNSTPLNVLNFGSGAGVQVASIPLPGIPGIRSPSAAGQAYGVSNDVMTFSSQVKLSAWDFEGLHDTTLWGWQMRGTLGMRYGYVSQGYGATRANSGAGVSGPAAINLAADNEMIQAGHNFSGLGPTTAIILRHPLGDTNVSFFLSDRVSALFGDSNVRDFQLTQLVGTSTLPGGPSTPLNSLTSVGFSTRQSICVAAEDFEVGVEWERTVGRSRVFLRTSFVDQDWFDAGTPTQPHGLLMMLGMSVTAGIIF